MGIQKIWLSVEGKSLAKVLPKRPGVSSRSIPYSIYRCVNRYIRFEYIEEDFNAILHKVGVLDWVSVPNRNPTSCKKTYQDYYTYKSRKLIEKVFSQELTKFGYTFGKH